MNDILAVLIVEISCMWGIKGVKIVGLVISYKKIVIIKYKIISIVINYLMNDYNDSDN